MGNEHHHEHHHEHGLRRQLWLIAETVGLLIFAVSIEKTQSLATWQLLLVYLVPYLIIGAGTLKEAAEGLLEGDPFNEHFLMAIATIGALCIGFLPGAETEFPEAVFVMLFFQVGELFEGYAEGKSRESISHLMDIRPDIAHIEVGDEKAGMKEVTVSPDEVTIGSTIVVRPGEKVPLDGVVISGASSLNTMALTGESVPREVGEEDEVISGCININGVLRIRTTKSFGESTVSKIIRLVEDAGEHKSQSETFITRFDQIRPHLYPCSRVLGYRHCGVATLVCLSYLRSIVPHRFPHLAVSSLDVPGGQLSLCISHQCAPDLLWRHWRCFAERYSGEGRQLFGPLGKGGYRGVRQDRNPHAWTFCRGGRTSSYHPYLTHGCPCGALHDSSHWCCPARRLPR